MIMPIITKTCELGTAIAKFAPIAAPERAKKNLFRKRILNEEKTLGSIGGCGNDVRD